MASTIKTVLYDFLDIIKSGEIEIYNEASLQFELAIYLREKLTNSKILLERNISNLGLVKYENGKKIIEKSEIDILISDAKKGTHFIIELKAPINQNQVRPVTIFNLIEDIKFLEELQAHAIPGIILFITDQLGYMKGNRTTGPLLTDIRKGELSGSYNKHQKIQDGKEPITLKNKYNPEWKNLGDKLNYFVLEFN